MIEKPMKFTRVCPQPCGDQYGLWRERCPSCGRYNERRMAAISEPDKPQRRRRKDPATGCIACHRRVKGAKVRGTTHRMEPTRCPHCNEYCHTVCLRLHAEGCKEFQKSLEAEKARLHAAP